MAKGVTVGCDILHAAGIGQNNTGIRYDPDSEDEVTLKDIDIVKLCLTCGLPECIIKIRDDRKAGVKTWPDIFARHANTSMTMKPAR